jgi:Na+/melibiose symporter-like transporter
MVADYTYEKDRGKGMAMNGVMIGLASIIVFAVLSPVLARAGVAILIYIIAAIALVGGISTGLFLKDRMPESRQDSTGLKGIVPVVKKSISLKASYLCCLVTRADIVVLATFLVAWGVKYGESVEMDAQTATLKASMPMIIMGVASLAAFPILGVLLDKWGRVQAILLSLISGGIAMVLLAMSPNPFSILVYVAMIFVAVGMAGAITGANTLASDASPKGMVGSILGGLNTMQPIGILFFVGVGGYLFDKIGPGAAFALKGFASLLLGVWFFMIKGTIKEELQHPPPPTGYKIQ